MYHGTTGLIQMEDKKVESSLCASFTDILLPVILVVLQQITLNYSKSSIKPKRLIICGN